MGPDRGPNVLSGLRGRGPKGPLVPKRALGALVELARSVKGRAIKQCPWSSTIQGHIRVDGNNPQG